MRHVDRLRSRFPKKMGDRPNQVGGQPVDTQDVSDSSQQEGTWRARPALSVLLKILIYTTPIAIALATTATVRSLMPVPTDRTGWVLWWALLLGVGAISAMVVERFSRRLFPLATLLKLTMLFPDRAPSRFRVARQSGSLRALKDHDADKDHPGYAAGTILALITALSAHDRVTRGHAERVRVFTDLLSEELGLHERDRAKLRWAALLHDIGKLSVDPLVLNKASKLDEAEWAAIRKHPSEGAKIAAPLLEWLGPWGGAIAQHHERFDGKGYPAGLAGTHICYAARIVSVADAYDTMTSARSYQKPRVTAAARQELVACAGTQFDPPVVKAFLAIALPRLLWATGPVSLLVHLPFLAHLQEIGQASIAAAAQTATVAAVSGITAVALLAPAARAAGQPVVHMRAAASQQVAQPAPGYAWDSSTHPHHGGNPGTSPGSGGPGGSGGGQQAPNSPGSGGSGSGGSGSGGSGSGGSGSGGSGSGGSGSGGSGSGGSGSGGSGSGGSGGSQSGSASQAINRIQALRALIAGSGIDGPTMDGLAFRLDDAAAKVGNDQLQAAVNRLAEFTSKVSLGVSKGKIDAVEGATWNAEAQAIELLLA